MMRFRLPMARWALVATMLGAMVVGGAGCGGRLGPAPGRIVEKESEDLHARVTALEREVARLRLELSALRGEPVGTPPATTLPADATTMPARVPAP